MKSPAPSNHTYDMRNHLLPQRITNAMWDFSWLNGHHPGGPFADWDRALDDLVERGFNAVRINSAHAYAFAPIRKPLRPSFHRQP